MGLKAKILLGLSGLLLLAIAGNLFFSNHLLVTDKKAYIFESNLKSTEEVKSLIETSIQHSLIQSETLSYLSVSNPRKANELFQKQDLMDAMYVVTDNKTVISSMWKDSLPERSESYPAFLKKWIEDPVPQKDAGLFLKKLKNFNIFELKFRQEDRTLGILINMESLWSKISGDMVFSYLIVSKDNEVLWNTGKDQVENFISTIPSSENIVSKELKLGGQKFLTSSVMLSSSGLRVFSYIPSSRAFAVISDIMFRFVAFGSILLGISLIVGLVFSSKLTNPIKELLKGVKRISEGDFSYQVRVTSKDELLVLGKQFNFMGGKIKDLLGEKEVIIDELKKANIQIEDYSKNLELKVEERTRELKSARDFIQTMVDSLDQGLLVFDKDLKCADIHTKACEQLFEKSPAGLTFTELLNLDEEKSLETSLWAEIMFSEQIAFETGSELGIKEKIFGTPQEDQYKVINLRYHPMRSDDGSISNIVAVATDKTSEVKAIEESKKQQQYVEMIFKILSAKKQFLNLDQEITESFEILDQIFLEDQPDLNKAMLLYHTFTGGLAMYSIESLVSETRRCEQSIVDMKKTGELDLPLLQGQKENFKNVYFKFQKETREILGLRSNTVEIDMGVVLQLNELIKRSGNEEAIKVFTENTLKSPVEHFLAPYAKLLSTLGPKLEKEFLPLYIENGNVRVFSEEYREFFSALVHLIRNCADHGIEAPHVRLERAKDACGFISITAELNSEEKKFKLIVTDDGGGIDPEKIRNKLRQKHSSTYREDETDSEVIYHIFDPDFSTAEQLTAISGRGVGMSAIKDVVDRMKGQITIHSVVGQGSRFIFELPESSF